MGTEGRRFSPAPKGMPCDQGVIRPPYKQSDSRRKCRRNAAYVVDGVGYCWEHAPRFKKGVDSVVRENNE